MNPYKHAFVIYSILRGGEVTRFTQLLYLSTSLRYLYLLLEYLHLMLLYCNSEVHCVLLFHYIYLIALVTLHIWINDVNDLTFTYYRVFLHCVTSTFTRVHEVSTSPTSG